MYIDTHAHLDFRDYDSDLDKVVSRALEAGVGQIITIGTTLANSRKTLAISRKYPSVFAAVGIHPHDAGGASEDVFEELRKLAEKNQVVAIGETGLDYFKEYSPREKQIACFRRQINLARDLSLPLIIHDREAHAETVELLRSERAREVGGVFHCFSGDYDLAHECLEMGFYISFTGAVTFAKSGSAQDVARKMPLDRLLIETDAPFLTPVPYRGTRNEPAYVVYVARKIAELRNCPLEEIAECTLKNSQALFRLPVP